MAATDTDSTSPAAERVLSDSTPGVATARNFVLNTRPLFKLMVEKKASDLFFTSHAPIKIKIEGQIIPVNRQVLTPEQVQQAAYGLMNQEQIDYFQQELEIDFAVSEPGLGRFRVAVFHQRGNPAMVLRYITAELPKLDDLGLPEIMKDLVMIKRGLVLMVGATGSGKSTSLAAMINYRNENSSDHILTVEDPIEFLHSNKKSIVNQREVGLDTKSFHRALRSAMRAAPDVILIGEIRDRESMEYAITFAAREQRCRDARPHHQHVPARPALADLPRPVAVPEGDPVAAPGDGHERQALRRDRSAAQHAARAGARQEGRCGRRQGSADPQRREGHAELRRRAVPALPAGQDHARGGDRECRFAHQPGGEDQFRLRRFGASLKAAAVRQGFGCSPVSRRKYARLGNTRSPA
jgi:energy-coupling factor transporter ATP-binding protein EcfA2